MLSFHPLESFDDRVQELIEEFRSEWERHWGLGRNPPRDQSVDDTLEIRSLYATADRLVRAAEALDPSGLPHGKRSLPGWLAENAEAERASLQELMDGLRTVEPFTDPSLWTRFQQALREKSSPDQQKELFFRTAVEFKLFERFAPRPGAVASRALQLLPFLMQTRSGRARQYLTRVARCFILDLQPELVIMCRAVLDAALEDADLDSTVVARIREVQGGSNSMLTVRIEAAKQTHVLDVSAYRAAIQVRDAGNDAVHNVPGQVPEAFSILSSLRTVLEQRASYPLK
jgi:hypothetical protein